jgi:hypothetical protein
LSRHMPTSLDACPTLIGVDKLKWTPSNLNSRTYVHWADGKVPKAWRAHDDADEGGDVQGRCIAAAMVGGMAAQLYSRVRPGI